MVHNCDTVRDWSSGNKSPAVAVSNSPTTHSRLLPLGFPEYKNTVSQEGEESTQNIQLTHVAEILVQVEESEYTITDDTVEKRTQFPKTNHKLYSQSLK